MTFENDDADLPRFIDTADEFSPLVDQEDASSREDTTLPKSTESDQGQPYL